MANINRKRTTTVRIDEETRNLLRDLSLDFSSIERKNVTISEIVNRTFKSLEVIDKLKVGSLERKTNRK